MSSVGREIKAGWNEARWSLYFGIVGLPLTLLACFVAYFIEGKITNPPSALTWAIIAPAILLSAVLTGIWDGPDGRFGRAMWNLIFFAFALRLIWCVRRDRRRNQPTRIRFLGVEFTISLDGEVSARLAERSLGWRDILHLHLQQAGTNSHRMVSVGV